MGPCLGFSQGTAAQRGVIADLYFFQTQMYVLTVGGQLQELHNGRPNGGVKHPSGGGLIRRNDLVRSPPV